MALLLRADSGNSCGRCICGTLASDEPGGVKTPGSVNKRGGKNQDSVRVWRDREENTIKSSGRIILSCTINTSNSLFDPSAILIHTDSIKLKTQMRSKNRVIVTDNHNPAPFHHHC